MGGNPGRCERCGGVNPPKEAEALGGLLDYCAACSKNLCNACMAKGCCGNKPAESGMKSDYGNEDE